MSHDPSPEAELSLSRSLLRDVLTGVEEPDTFLAMLRAVYTHEVVTIRIEIGDED